MQTQPRSGWPAIHGGLLVACFILAGFLPRVLWPWYLVLPLTAYVGLALLVPPLRRTMPVLRPGRADRIGWTAAVILSTAAAGVLLGYQRFYHPDVSSLAANLPAVLFDSLILGGLCFSVLNAVLEELMCRWVLYDAVAAEWGAAAAIVITSAFFGFAHLHGYPPGPLGAVLAGLFGLGLALLRWWTGGLALCACCHVCADVTIFWIIASEGLS